jgi:hypothetical protein
MMHAISWGQFFEVTAILVAFYYVGVGLGFYRKEIMGFLTGRGKVSAGERVSGGEGKVKAVEAGVLVAAPVAPEAVDGGQATLFEEREHSESPEMFKVMEKVIGLLKGVVSQAVAERLPVDDLLDHFREVLGNFGQLKGTPYQIAINNFLARTCTSNFSLVLDEDGVGSLWG